MAFQYVNSNVNMRQFTLICNCTDIITPNINQSIILRFFSVNIRLNLTPKASFNTSSLDEVFSLFTLAFDLYQRLSKYTISFAL